MERADGEGRLAPLRHRLERQGVRLQPVHHVRPRPRHEHHGHSHSGRMVVMQFSREMLLSCFRGFFKLTHEISQSSLISKSQDAQIIAKIFVVGAKGLIFLYKISKNAF
jgi:hypothetical protein